MKGKEIFFERAIRNEKGFWAGCRTEPIEEQQLPAFLNERAKGKFPLIERFLTIPKRYKAQHVLSLAAVGAALEVNKAIREEKRADFDTDIPQVTLIIDDHHLQEFLPRQVGFKVEVGDATFVGSLFFPVKDSGDQHRSGFPSYVIEQDTRVGLTCTDFLESDNMFSSKGQEFVDFIRSQID